MEHHAVDPSHYPNDRVRSNHGPHVALQFFQREDFDRRCIGHGSLAPAKLASLHLQRVHIWSRRFAGDKYAVLSDTSRSGIQEPPCEGDI